MASANDRFSSSKPIMLPIIVILLAGLLAFGLVKSGGGPEQKDEEAKVPLVSVETVELGDMGLLVRSQGIFKPHYETSLVAQVSGEIIALAPAFERGGIVQKGELLAQIDPFNYEVQLQDARAQLAAAQAALVLEEAQGAVAKAEWEKINDTAPTELSLRKPQLEQAQARVRAAEAGVKQAAKNLERTRIVAPFAALVRERKVSLGTFVGTGAPIGNVLNVARGEVRLPVASNELQYLVSGGVGAAVALSSEAGGLHQQWQAKIIRSEGLIDENSRMVYLVAEVRDPYKIDDPSSDMALPFGAYVIAQIEGRQLQNATIVPRQLVQNDKIATFVDGKLVFRPVEVARIQGNSAVIEAGLLGGESIITSSLQYPFDGMPIQLLGAEPTPDEGEIASEIDQNSGDKL